jgi:hypothetical protein
VGYLSPQDRKRIIAEIRRLKTEHWYSDKQIMDMLKISKPTLVRYKRFMYTENNELFETMTREEIVEHVDTVTSRLTWIAQKFKEIAEKAEADGDRIAALDKLYHITIALGKIDTQEREEILEKYGNGDADNRQEDNTARQAGQQQTAG